MIYNLKESFFVTKTVSFKFHFSHTNWIFSTSTTTNWSKERKKNIRKFLFNNSYFCYFYLINCFYHEVFDFEQSDGLFQLYFLFKFCFSVVVRVDWRAVLILFLERAGWFGKNNNFFFGLHWYYLSHCINRKKKPQIFTKSTILVFDSNEIFLIRMKYWNLNLLGNNR